MELLLLLARNRGKLATREQVAAHIWGVDHYIDSESAINTAVRKLRKVLEAGVDGVQWIETVPAKGYRGPRRRTMILTYCGAVRVRSL